MTTLVATSVGPFTDQHGTATLCVGIADGKLEGLGRTGDAEAVLHRWRARQLFADYACTPELAEAGRSSQWRVVPMDDELRRARAAVIAMIPGGGLMSDFRDLEPLYELQRGSAAWLAAPVDTDLIYALGIEQQHAGALAHTTTGAAWVYVGQDRQHTSVHVFPAVDDLQRYRSLVDADDLDAAMTDPRILLYHRPPPPELAAELRATLAAELAPIATIASLRQRAPIPAMSLDALAALTHAFAQLGAAASAAHAIQIGDRRITTKLSVLDRLVIKS